VTNTLPERSASPLELARETARNIPCDCGARAGYACDGRGGIHLARFASARREGRVTEASMAVVLAAAGDVFTPWTIIPGGAG